MVYESYYKVRYKEASSVQKLVNGVLHLEFEEEPSCVQEEVAEFKAFKKYSVHYRDSISSKHAIETNAS